MRDKPNQIKAIDLSSEEYRNLKLAHERIRKASIESGHFDEALHLYEEVRDEFLLISDSSFSRFAGTQVSDWKREKKAAGMDLVMTYCGQKQIAPPPKFMEIYTEVASARLFDGYIKDNPNKLISENLKSQALTLILNLIYIGDTLSIASRKAAEWYKSEFPQKKPIKASTLEKYYVKTWRETGQESRIFSTWDKQGTTEEYRLWWENLAKRLPLADEELTGNRRQ